MRFIVSVLQRLQARRERRDRLRSCIRFPLGAYVKLNRLGSSANMSMKGRSVWRVEEVIVVPDSTVHPERYVLDPPHYFGPVCGMFLERATAADIEEQRRIDAGITP